MSVSWARTDPRNQGARAEGCLPRRGGPPPAPRATERVSRLALLVPVLSWGCAGEGAPTRSQFPSIREPSDAYTCATGVLRREGFEASQPTGDPLSGVMLRYLPPTPHRQAEWWRVEITVTRDDDGRTAVSAVAGAAPRVDGPYTAPPADLQHILGMTSARCMWQR